MTLPVKQQRRFSTKGQNFPVGNPYRSRLLRLLCRTKSRRICGGGSAGKEFAKFHLLDSGGSGVGWQTRCTQVLQLEARPVVRCLWDHGGQPGTYLLHPSSLSLTSRRAGAACPLASFGNTVRPGTYRGETPTPHFNCVFDLFLITGGENQ